MTDVSDTTAPFDGGHLEESLSAFLDGELDEAAQRAAYHHLAVCLLCQGQLDSVQRVRTALRGAPPVEPPGGFIDAVVEHRPRPRHSGATPDPTPDPTPDATT